MDVLAQIWSFFASYPTELALASDGLIIGVTAVMAILIVVWRKNAVVMSAAIQWTPFAIFAITFPVRWIASAPWVGNDITTVLWILFGIASLTSLIWSLINLIRVVANK